MIYADDIAPQPWRNGGGTTRELLAWPSAEHCNLRIALADIAMVPFIDRIRTRGGNPFVYFPTREDALAHAGKHVFRKNPVEIED